MLEDGHGCTSTTQSDKYHDEGYHDHLSASSAWVATQRTHYYSQDFKKRLKIFKF